MAKEKEKGRGEYSVSDVIDVIREGTVLELYQVTRFFPAMVNGLIGDPLGTFSATFGSKRADGAEYKLRQAIGALGGEPAAEGPAGDGEAGDPVPAEEPAPAPDKVKAEAVPAAAAAPVKKAKSKDEDDIDALLNQLDEVEETPETNE